MRILFLESKPAMTGLLPKGFRDAGFEVMVSAIISPEQLDSLMSQFQPHLVFTQGWGDEQTHEKQIWIRNLVTAMNIPHVYWSIEDPIYTDYFVVPLIRVAQPDFIFTISEQHVDFYRSLGYPSAHLDWGVHLDANQPSPDDYKYEVDIALISNSYYESIADFDVMRKESMEILLKPLIEAGMRVDIWGKGWEHIHPILGVRIPPDWLRGELPYTACNQVYRSAKIILGFQNVDSQVTQRTYEVLAAGGVLLTVHTPAVRERFTHKKHLLASNAPGETMKLVKKYLPAEGKRKKLGLLGRAAVMQHNYISRVGYMMDTLTREGIFQ